jgi:hypothetical protein
VQSQAGRQEPGQRRDHGAVGPVRPRPSGLAAQPCDLVAENQDLRVFDGVAPGEQGQPPEESGHEQVDETDDHENQA